jgi:adenosine deaminase
MAAVTDLPAPGEADLAAPGEADLAAPGEADLAAPGEADLADALRKVELHCHVEGTMRPETVVALAAKNGVPLPAGDVRDLYRYRSLDEFLAVFWLVQSVLADRGDWERLGYECVLDGAAAGRVYAEVFVTPGRHLAAGQTLSSVLAGLSAGLAAGDAQTGCRTMIIVDMDRAYGGDAGLALVSELIELRRAGAPGTDRVLGIGMDSTEYGVDPLIFAPAYREAAAAGLRRTGHQGENSPAAAIGAVAVGLGAERIDHGLSLIDDPDLIAFFADRRIPLTMCPTSNVVIANAYSTLSAHPLPRLRAAGVLVTVNTDDPALTDLDLAREYAACAGAWGWTFDQMVDVALDGVEASWLDDSDKRALAARVRAEAARIRASARGIVPASSPTPDKSGK